MDAVSEGSNSRPVAVFLPRVLTRLPVPEKAPSIRQGGRGFDSGPWKTGAGIAGHPWLEGNLGARFVAGSGRRGLMLEYPRNQGPAADGSYGRPGRASGQASLAVAAVVSARAILGGTWREA